MQRDVAVLAFDGVHLASIGLFLDLFAMMQRRVANQFKGRDDVGMQTRVRLLGLHPGSIRTAGNRRLEVDGQPDDGTAHLLIHIPDFEWPDEGSTSLAHMRAGIAWLARQHRAGAHLSATGRGIYLLAEAGLIGNGPAPQSRVTAETFRLRYPHIRADTKSEIVEQGTILMARGMAHEMTMLTRLIARLMSSTMAGTLAGAMGVETGREGLSHDPLIAAAQIWLSENASSGKPIAALARDLAVSPQTLIRRFRSVMNTTPLKYRQMLRVRSAQTQLRDTDRSIAQIATLVGYDDLKSFQQAFRLHSGMSASRYRATLTASHPSTAILGSNIPQE